MMVDQQRVKELVSAVKEDLTTTRRHLHAHPELSFEEFNTSDFIAGRLREFGIDFEQGMVKTGIVGKIEGKNPSKNTIALRADIDALPIQEKNEVPYASQNKGVMHACGHDVHTTCLLGAAKVLNELRDSFEGTVKLIFQPGEEKIPGGATLMIDEGVLNNPSPTAIFGQHVFPELEVGKVGFRSGMYMASADEIYITVKGKGGHGALPHRVVDPVLMASHLVVALQQVISRNAHPLVPSVLSFGTIRGVGATNIIPDEVHLEGTFRTFDETWRAEAHDRITSLVQSITKGMGGEADLEIRRGYPFLVNDESLTTNAMHAARTFLGAEKVVDLDLRMTSEDFAYFSHALPATFFRLGTRNETHGITSNLHTNTFDVDEEALEVGAGLMAWLALSELAEGTH